MIDIGPSPFDVRLVAFRIPVRVHWSFWLAAILLGWVPDRADLVFIWVVCAFFSVLVHELGHAITAEWFGWPTEIVLYFGGGVAISNRLLNNTPGRSMFVSFMGPGAGFLFLGLVMAVDIALQIYRVPMNEHVESTIGALMFMNLFYGLFNLLPVVPLDGGHICYSLCQWFRLRDPIGITMKIGIVVSGAAAYFLFTRFHQQFAGAMMLMLCIQRISELQSRR